MSTIIFIGSNIPEIDLFKNSLNVEYYDFNLRNLIDFSLITRIGFIWENNFQMFPFGTTNYTLSNGKNSLYFSKELIDFFKFINKQIQIDFITCGLSTKDFKDELKLIQQEIYDINFDYSVNLTGSDPYGDWIMESSGTNIKNIYFNENIEKWKHTLLYARFFSTRPQIKFNTPITLKGITNSDLLKDISNVTNVCSSCFEYNDHLYTAIKSNGSGLLWGTNGYQNYGLATPLNNSTDLSNGVTISTNITSVYSNLVAFAAIKTNGSVVAWGNSNNGGSIIDVSNSLQSNVVSITSTLYAFAALKSDGSVVTWGDKWNGTSGTGSYTYFYNNNATLDFLAVNGSGANSSNVSLSLTSGVIKIVSTSFAFAALKSNGSVVTWGDSLTGGDSSSVASSLTSGVINIISNEYAFAAIKSDGSVITWGYSANGGNSSAVASSLTSDVIYIFNTRKAFAALKSNGSVVTWGNTAFGANSSLVASSLTSGIINIVSTESAFAAIKSNGSVITWGNSTNGGSIIDVSNNLKSNVTHIYSSLYAFAALKSNGSVITWGGAGSGGNSSTVTSNLNSQIINIFNTTNAFAALKSDGSVITWGSSSFGGNSSSSGNSIVYSYAGIRNFIYVSSTTKPPAIPGHYSSSSGKLQIIIPDYINQNITSIDYSINSQDWIQVNSSSFTINNLIVSTGYFIKIRATNNLASGEYNGFYVKSDENGSITISTYLSLSNQNLSNTDLSNMQIFGITPGPFTGVPSSLPSSNYKVVTNHLGNFLIGPGVKLENCDLSGCDLSGCDLSGCDLSGCNLSGCNLLNTKLFNVTSKPIIGLPLTLPSKYKIINYKTLNYIIGPNLNLSYIDLSGCDLSNSNLTGCNLSNANLTNTNLFKTNLSFADLSGTNLFGVNLSGVNITNIYNKPININSNWSFDNSSNSIIPSSSNDFRDIINYQIQNSNNMDLITIYKSSDILINQSATLIKPNISHVSQWSSPTNNYSITIKNNTNLDVKNILINLLTESETNITFPSINNEKPLFLLFFKALDSSANSVVTQIKPVSIEIIINTNSNYVLLYKYTNQSFDINNFIVGRKITSDSVSNIYRFRFTSNSNYGALTANTISILTGGDPHIRPLIGHQYILPNDIKFVCLLNDPIINFQINACVSLMKKSDFPDYVFAKDKWLNSKKLPYLFKYSYYKEFYISIGSEHILINSDTLEIKTSSNSNIKIKYFHPNAKNGLYSLIHKLQYPLFKTTKILKIFIDKYIITLMSDINTDERHFINLEYYGLNDIMCFDGALISKLKILQMNDIIGTNKNYYYKEYYDMLAHLKQLEKDILLEKIENPINCIE